MRGFRRKILLILILSSLVLIPISFFDENVKNGESIGHEKIAQDTNQPPVFLEPRYNVTITVGTALGFPFNIFDEYYEGTWRFYIYNTETWEIVYENSGDWEYYDPRPDGYEIYLYGGVYLFDEIGVYFINMEVEDIWGAMSLDESFVVVEYEEVEIKLQVKALVSGEWENPNGKIIYKEFYKVETKSIPALYDPINEIIINLDELAVQVFESEVIRKYKNIDLRDFILSNYEIVRVRYEII